MGYVLRPREENLESTSLTTGLDNTHLLFSITAGAGTRCDPLLSSRISLSGPLTKAKDKKKCEEMPGHVSQTITKLFTKVSPLSTINLYKNRNLGSNSSIFYNSSSLSPLPTSFFFTAESNFQDHITKLSAQESSTFSERLFSSCCLARGQREDVLDYQEAPVIRRFLSQQHSFFPKLMMSAVGL